MTICNMSIEAGAKVGLVGVDETTISYIKNAARLNENEIKNAETYWQTLHSDDDASFDKELKIDVSLIKPQVTWEHHQKWLLIMMLIFQ